jgi:hypothetical protein
MQDKVVRMLRGLICEGKLIPLVDIEDSRRKIYNSNVHLAPVVWESSLSEPQFLIACGRRRTFRLPNTQRDPRFVINVRFKASELGELLSSISQSATQTNISTAGRDRRRTALAGRPSSWNLMERECRRRFAEGEKYPNDRTGLESSSKWARVRIPWFKEAHPDELVPKEKTLTNHLSKLLRELAPGNPTPSS